MDQFADHSGRGLPVVRPPPDWSIRVRSGAPRIRWFGEEGTCRNSLTGTCFPWTLARCVGVAAYYVSVIRADADGSPLLRVARDRKPVGEAEEAGGKITPKGGRSASGAARPGVEMWARVHADGPDRDGR
jgi:hypothetical protein